MKCKKLFALLLSLCMIASTFVALPVSAEAENVIDINLPLDDASELTWVQSGVTVSNADGIGGRDKVVKAEGVSDSNNNTVGVKLPDGFAFAEGDVLTYSIDVYSEAEIKPDLWLRNHSTFNPMAVFYSNTMETSTWTTLTKTVTYEELEAIIPTVNSNGTFSTSGNYAFYIRPRVDGAVTLYLDNLTLTVAREVVARDNVIDIEVNTASDITWISTDAVTVSDANGIGGRDGVIELAGLANSNNNTAGVVLGESFAFAEGDILTYSLDVYSDAVTHPDIWLRNHGSSLSPFKQFFNTITTGEWTTISRTVTYADLIAEGAFDGESKYALYVRPREAGTVYIDNFKVTVSREGYVEPEPTPEIDIDYSKYETTILTGTDFQAADNGVGAQNVNDIISSIETSGLLGADAFFFCGDYENTSQTATTEGVTALKEAVIDFVPNEDNHVYVQGNHDEALGVEGLSKSGNNDPASGEYGVFVIHEDEYGTENNIARVMDTANNLASYLNAKLEAGYDKPIFVLSHLPLYYSLRTLNDANAKYGNHIFHVLNQAGEQGLNIFFLAGHDHSKAYESYLGGSSVYLAKGDKINVAQGSVVNFEEETLNFTYMNAGYVGYYNAGNGGDNILNMLVIGIDEDTNTVDVYRFDKGGLHNLKSAGKLLEGEEDLYKANTTVYASPQSVALTEVNYKSEITTLPAVAEGGVKVVEIDAPFDDVSEVTWIATNAVKVSNADGIGGRDKVIKAEGLANSNNNTVGVKIGDNFSFCEGDIISYSFDVYSETPINPDIWIRNHGASLNPFDTFYNGKVATNTWTTIARTIEFVELNEDYDWTTIGNYAIYLRPRQDATVYLDNIKVTIIRDKSQIVVKENVVDIDLPLDDTNELTWVASGVTVSNADGIGGRDKVIKAAGLANGNNNTAGVKLPDGFAFAEGDILSYSIDVYSETAVNPDMWLRNHGSALTPFATFYESTISANTWTTITKTFTYEELVQKVAASGSSGSFDVADNYAFYLRPRSNATIYLDNLKVTVTREVTGEEEPTYIPGDIDDNGEVAVRDVIFLRRHIAGGYDITVNEATLDVDRDGEVAVRDVITLRRFIAGGYGVELK
ncbi:MAG: dockerin type I repeat-containing protein [Clostridia bacterium]|nr:dockerin type I repeat-containing protein [Clostridia bacterium]